MTTPYVDHGDRHRSGKSDPIPGLIVFDADNVGSYLHIETTAVDDEASAVVIVNSVYGDTYWYPSGTGQDLDCELFILGDDGSQFYMDSGGGINLDTESANIQLSAYGAHLIKMRIDTGGSFLIEKFSGGTDLFEVSNAGEIFAHLPTSPGTPGSLWNDSGTVKVA